MRFMGIKSWVVLLVLVSVFGCSRQESKLVGTWKNVKTSSSITFNKDKTGVINQRTNPHIPADIPFKWAMLKDGAFKVEVVVAGGSSVPAAEGKLSGDTMVLGEDTFTKAK
jgi:hypothetical protein